MIDEKNIVYNKAYIRAINIVKVFKKLTTEKKEFVLSKQLLKSGTSIGANIAEANGGISKADFSAKISLAYKETLETKYWLSLLKDTDYLEYEKFEGLFNRTDEIAKILYTILKKTRINKH